MKRVRQTANAKSRKRGRSCKEGELNVLNQKQAKNESRQELHIEFKDIEKGHQEACQDMLRREAQ